MKHPDETLVTPIYVKTDPQEPWPRDQVFYVLASNGLFRCRNNEFFISSVPARTWPSELASQQTFLKIRCPKIPCHLMELAVGFFASIYQRHGAEAAVLLIWDRTARQVRLLVPEQESEVSKGWSGRAYPIDVHYEIPADLPADQYVLGDIHCHCDGWAYSSWVDKKDETFRTGMHIVVGRITREPPEFHVEAVVDGVRFRVKPELVLEGYHRRRLDFPKEWLDRVKVGSWRSRYDQKSSRPGGPACREQSRTGEMNPVLTGSGLACCRDRCSKTDLRDSDGHAWEHDDRTVGDAACCDIRDAQTTDSTSLPMVLRKSNPPVEHSDDQEPHAR
jgi:hypothetical protein